MNRGHAGNRNRGGKTGSKRTAEAEDEKGLRMLADAIGHGTPDLNASCDGCHHKYGVHQKLSASTIRPCLGDHLDGSCKCTGFKDGRLQLGT